LAIGHFRKPADFLQQFGNRGAASHGRTKGTFRANRVFPGQAVAFCFSFPRGFG
jgi:hypothetical protein